MRVVVDTNVLVSGFLRPGGTVGAVVDALREGRYRYLYSRPTLDELVDVLARPRLKETYGIRARDVEALLKLLLLRGDEVVPGKVIRACRDPKDDKFLEVAATGRADALVSGDGDLKALDPFEGIRILSPARFLEILERAGGQ